MRLVKWPKIVSQKAKNFRNFRNKSRSIFMLNKIDRNKKCAPKLIFSNDFFRKIQMLKINFEKQSLALFDTYFWPFNKSHNNFPQSGPALQGCTVNVPVPKAVSS